MAARRLLLTTDAVGGVWQYSTDLARALQPFGYEVVLAVLGPGLNAIQRAEARAITGLTLIETGLELDWLTSEPEPILQAEVRLAALARDVDADLVQLHTPALVSARAYDCPVLAVLHSCVATWWEAVRGGDMPADFEWRTALVSQGLRRATLVVPPSAAFGEAARRRYGLTSAPATVHNGRAFTVKRAAMQDYVFTAGRLWDGGKNVRVLDAAAGRLGVPFKAAGPLRAPHGEVFRLENGHHLGELAAPRLAKYLAQRPVFASAALYEPFGLAVLEAAMAGCALVLSDIPTFRELWDGAAVFVDPRDPEAFAQAITEMIGDMASRVEAGQRAQARSQQYTPTAMATQMAGLYARMDRKAAA